MTAADAFEDPAFHVVPGDAVDRALAADPDGVCRAVEDAYRLLAAGEAANPHSHFLRFPDRSDTRIIALPAYVGGGVGLAGIKWIASVPANRAANLARGSAVLVLNDAATGYPVACIEAAAISAERTACSAAIAAEALTPGASAVLAVVGTGIIARTTVARLLRRGWTFPAVRLHDLDRREADRFAAWLEARGNGEVTVADEADAAIRGARLVLIATTAATPHLADPAVFAAAPTVLHLSLRDIGVAPILAAQNLVDDVDHALRAQTSLHLAEQAVGHRGFVAGTLVDLLDGRIAADPARARIFSPFGLGVLDVALGALVYRHAVATGSAIRVPGFFAQARRW